MTNFDEKVDSLTKEAMTAVRAVVRLEIQCLCARILTLEHKNAELAAENKRLKEKLGEK